MASGNRDADRFEIFNSQEIKDNNDGQVNKNSVKNEEKAIKCFKAFLSANKEEDTDFFEYPDEKLDKWLAKFYWGACTEKGEKYSCSTMTTMRYGLNRALQKHEKSYDITKKQYKNFIYSINSFEMATRDLKKSGKGTVKNTPEITPACKFSMNLPCITRRTILLFVSHLSARNVIFIKKLIF